MVHPLLLLVCLGCLTFLSGTALLVRHIILTGTAARLAATRGEPRDAQWDGCDQRQRCVRPCPGDPRTHPECCTAHMLALVRAVAAAARSAAGIEVLAIAGTLLGAMRNGQIIPWTADVDLGVPAHDMPALMDALRQDPSVRVFLGDTIWRVCLAAPEGPATQQVVEPRVHAHNKIAYIDLFPTSFVEPAPRRRGGVAMGDLPCSPFPVDMIYPVQRAPVCLYNDTGACLSVMAQPERYLAHLYGPTWRTPPVEQARRLHGLGEHKCYRV